MKPPPIFRRFHIPEHYRKVKTASTQTWALAKGLREFFRESVAVGRAEKEIRLALENRNERFLELCRGQIYARPGGAYFRLLKTAGCAWSDLRASVHRHGIEKTLERLAVEGVYLTADEFKGKKPVVRGAVSFSVSPEDFDSPTPGAGFRTQSSGATNRPVETVTSLDRLAFQALGKAVFFRAHDLYSAAHAIYDAVLPGSGGVSYLLGVAKLGVATERWFARSVPVQSWMQRQRARGTADLIVFMGNYFGPGFPRPELAETRDVERIALWAAGKSRRGEACCVRVSASNAVRIARAALEMGISLAGVRFMVGGEPFTDAKRDAVVRAGAGWICLYSFSGAGIVAYGCANPVYTDEMHVSRYMAALVDRPQALGAAYPAIHPFLWTTLHPFASRMLFNVENGDYARLESRDCGCALERAGFTLHLCGLRSYEKFTVEGMNYFCGDLLEFLERTLPAELGGGPGDYQLAEEEDEGGQTRIALRIHPRVGAIDEAVALTRLQQQLERGTWGNQFQVGVWRDADAFRIRRETPHASPRGKILPLDLSRR